MTQPSDSNITTKETAESLGQVQYLSQSTSRKITSIGADPGLTGAFAVITITIDTSNTTEERVTHTEISVVDLITKERSKTSAVKKQLDARACFDLLTSVLAQDAHAHSHSYIYSVEQVATRTGQGVVSQGSLMHSFGTLEAICDIHAEQLKVPSTVQLVRPQAWKPAFALTGKDIEKEDSVSKCQALFPERYAVKNKVIWLKKHNNRADAILIAAHALLTSRHGHAFRNYIYKE